MLSDNERSVLAGFFSEKGILFEALEKFAQSRQQAMDSSASMELRQRRMDHAADYAAKSEVYQNLLSEIESFAKNP